MLFADVARTSAEVAALPGRRAKVLHLASCLQAAAEHDDRTVELAVLFLSGELRQRRTGIGHTTLRSARVDPHADRDSGSAADPPLSLHEVDAVFASAERASGAGSAAVRRDLLAGLARRCSGEEWRLVAGLVSGDLRQGAARGLLADAVAAASGTSATAVRRALTLSGSLPAVAVTALRAGAAGLDRYALVVGRGLSPMLASTAPDVATAVAALAPAAVEWKLDGIRVQVHRDAETVRVLTRTLDDITYRVPQVVATVLALPVSSVVLDGELIMLDPDGRPRPFQETSARVATRGAVEPDGPGPDAPASAGLDVVVFDVLLLDGYDLTERPLAERRAALESVAGPGLLVPQVVVADVDEVPAAEAFAADALARGHEGVVVKALGAGYEMGRRGGAWLKVKPVHTLDLVVLAAERGHGRRAGWLSNLHLGARGPAGGFVMLGKTFKGLTDAVLAWQTERFRELQVSDDGWVVTVRPEQVVEVAFDGVQRSPRYPGGVALRFARVVRYRDDKTADEADTVEVVRGLLPPGASR